MIKVNMKMKIIANTDLMRLNAKLKVGAALIKKPCGM